MEYIKTLISENLIGIVSLLVTAVLSPILGWFLGRRKTKQEISEIELKNQKIQEENEKLEEERRNLEEERRKTESQRTTIDLENIGRVAKWWEERYDSILLRLKDLEFLRDELSKEKEKTKQLEIKNGELEKKIKEFDQFKEFTLDLLRAFNYLASAVGEVRPKEVEASKLMIAKYEKFLQEVGNDGSETKG